MTYRSELRCVQMGAPEPVSPRSYPSAERDKEVRVRTSSRTPLMEIDWDDDWSDGVGFILGYLIAAILLGGALLLSLLN